MELIFRAFNKEIKIQLENGLNVYDFLEEILSIFHIAGYHSESIKRAICELGEQYNQELYQEDEDSNRV